MIKKIIFTIILIVFSLVVVVVFADTDITDTYTIKDPVNGKILGTVTMSHKITDEEKARIDATYIDTERKDIEDKQTRLDNIATKESLKETEDALKASIKMKLSDLLTDEEIDFLLDK